jgi:hypothetical protein
MPAGDAGLESDRTGVARPRVGHVRRDGVSAGGRAADGAALARRTDAHSLRVRPDRRRRVAVPPRGQPNLERRGRRHVPRRRSRSHSGLLGGADRDARGDAAAPERLRTEHHLALSGARASPTTGCGGAPAGGTVRPRKRLRFDGALPHRPDDRHGAGSGARGPVRALSFRAALRSRRAGRYHDGVRSRRQPDNIGERQRSHVRGRESVPPPGRRPCRRRHADVGRVDS